MSNRFIVSLKKAILTAEKTLAAAGIFICIITIICTSIELFAYRHSVVGIVISSVLCSLLTIPITLICKDLFKNSNTKEQKTLLQAEQELKTLAEEKNDYKRRVLLLENLSFNMVTYQDVLKMCFRDYQQEGIIKQREQFNEEDYSNPIKKLFEMPSKNYDEVLSIIDWFVTYQRGVNLKNIKISKVNEDTVIISGITPEFTTPPRFEYKDFCTEIRHVKLDKNGETKQITIENGEKAHSVLNKKTAEYKKILEESFSKGGNTDEDAVEIKNRAQDFIRIILQPIYKNVEFEEKAISSDALPFLDFLTTETASYKKLITEEENKEDID